MLDSEKRKEERKRNQRDGSNHETEGSRKPFIQHSAARSRKQYGRRKITHHEKSIWNHDGCNRLSTVVRAVHKFDLSRNTNAASSGKTARAARSVAGTTRPTETAFWSRGRRIIMDARRAGRIVHFGYRKFCQITKIAFIVTSHGDER